MNTSYINRAEAEVCLKACQIIRNEWQALSPVTNQPVSIAIITPYREQVHLLKQIFRDARVKIDSADSIQINTVDAFQGNEMDLVIFSCVRAEEHSGIGFLDDARRLNVCFFLVRFKGYSD